MKTLRHSLLDYDMALLKAIAESRAINLNTTSQSEAVQQLTEALLSPAITAIALASLSKQEMEALQYLADYEGRVEISRLTRRFGSIRTMGASRLSREQPWRKPANALEGLWYKGFIFKRFQVTHQGSTEFIYIPNDLFPMLQLKLGQTNITAVVKNEVAKFEFFPMPPPTLIVQTSERLRENIFSLLACLHNNRLEMEAGLLPTPSAQQILFDHLLPPLFITAEPQPELQFLLHLAQKANLIEQKNGHLQLVRLISRRWLQAKPTQQIQALQQCWWGDATWNELWHVPTLAPQPTGWENNPLLARTKIIGYLAHASEEWISIEHFVKTVKQIEPDFQRPDGDYNKWYLQDKSGNFLMGFENWDAVEGALIRYLLTQILPWLGIVDLGQTVPIGPPTSLKITPLGRRFLKRQISLPAIKNLPSAESNTIFQIDEDFKVQVPSTTNLFDRFQLARFATFNRRDTDQTSYHLSPHSISQALKQGITMNQIVAFLGRTTERNIPAIVIESLRRWANRAGSARLQQVVLLHLTDEAVLPELRQNPDLEPILGPALNPQTVIIAVDDAPVVERILTELGYL